MSRLSKQQVRGPDAFVSWADRVAAFIEKNRRSLFVALAGTLGFSLLWIGKQYYDQHQEQLAHIDLYQAQKQYTQLLEVAKNKQSEEQKKMASLLGDTQLVVPLNTKLVQAWQLVLNKWPRSQAANQAAIDLADHYAQNKKYTEALNVLQARAGALRSSHFFYGLLHLHTGSVLMELEKYAEAVESFKKIIDSNSHAYLQPTAKYRMAMCYEKQNNPQQATEIYKALAASQDSGFVASQAKAQLRWLAFRSQKEPK